jgi:hypothetical protein
VRHGRAPDGVIRSASAGLLILIDSQRQRHDFRRGVGCNASAPTIQGARLDGYATIILQHSWSSLLEIGRPGDERCTDADGPIVLVPPGL